MAKLVPERVASFFEAYQEHLTRCVAAYPDHFSYGEANVPIVVARLRALTEEAGEFHILGSKALKPTAAALGIKATLKAANAYMRGEPVPAKCAAAIGEFMTYSGIRGRPRVLQRYHQCKSFAKLDGLCMVHHRVREADRATARDRPSWRRLVLWEDAKHVGRKAKP